MEEKQLGQLAQASIEEHRSETSQCKARFTELEMQIELLAQAVGHDDSLVTRGIELDLPSSSDFGRSLACNAIPARQPSKNNHLITTNQPLGRVENRHLGGRQQQPRAPAAEGSRLGLAERNPNTGQCEPLFTPTMPILILEIPI